MILAGSSSYTIEITLSTAAPTKLFGAISTLCGPLTARRIGDTFQQAITAAQKVPQLV